MPLLLSRPPILHLNDRNGPRDVKLKMCLSLRDRRHQEASIYAARHLERWPVRLLPEANATDTI